MKHVAAKSGTAETNQERHGVFFTKTLVLMIHDVRLDDCRKIASLTMSAHRSYGKYHARSDISPEPYHRSSPHRSPWVSLLCEDRAGETEISEEPASRSRLRRLESPAADTVLYLTFSLEENVYSFLGPED